jgi:hypothetical protein
VSKYLRQMHDRQKAILIPVWELEVGLAL